jgi:phosphohistidine phosphatase
MLADISRSFAALRRLRTTRRKLRVTRSFSKEETMSQKHSSGKRYVVLLRHGIAENRSVTGRDEDRKLTEEGNTQMQEVAAGLAVAFPDADAILASPLVRAQETARWAAQAYGSALTIETTRALIPDAESDELSPLLSATTGRRIILVGHEPNMSMNAAALIGGPDAAIDFKKAGAFCVRLFDDGAGVLQWMLTAELLQSMGRQAE